MMSKPIYFLAENNFRVSGLDVSELIKQIDPKISLVSWNDHLIICKDFDLISKFFW
jgi:hypothetical protein